MEDQKIIELFTARSESALQELSDKYGKLCRRIAINILGNEQDADECVNDTYLAVWNAIPPAAPSPLSAYVCRIARNLSLKRYRLATAQKRNAAYDMTLEELEECLSGRSSPEEELLVKELTDQINQFLRTLKKRERILFIRRYWFCCTNNEIAEELEISANSVAVHLHRIREKLKKHLQREGYL